MEAVTAVSTTVTSAAMDRSMPKAWAMKTTAAPCMMAVPSHVDGRAQWDGERRDTVVHAHLLLERLHVERDGRVTRARGKRERHDRPELAQEVEGIESRADEQDEHVDDEELDGQPQVHGADELDHGQYARDAEVAEGARDEAEEPMGATRRMTPIIFIMIALNCVKKRFTVATFLPRRPKMKPSMSAKKMMGSMSPLFIEATMFLGMMLMSMVGKGLLGRRGRWARRRRRPPCRDPCPACTPLPA